MLRTKITELGKLSLLDDGGLVCSVTSDEPPLLGESALRASFCWASHDSSALAMGPGVAAVGLWPNGQPCSQCIRYGQCAPLLTQL